jgi:hypothetical protein
MRGPSALDAPLNAAPTDARVPAATPRRALLTGAGLAAAALSGLALVRPAAAFNATPAENAPRYRESEHVKTFYRVVSR